MVSDTKAPFSFFVQLTGVCPNTRYFFVSSVGCCVDIERPSLRIAITPVRFAITHITRSAATAPSAVHSILSANETSVVSILDNVGPDLRITMKIADRFVRLAVHNILGASNQHPFGSQVCSRVASARVQDAQCNSAAHRKTRAKATRLHTCPGSGSTPGCIKVTAGDGTIRRR